MRQKAEGTEAPFSAHAGPERNERQRGARRLPRVAPHSLSTPSTPPPFSRTKRTLLKRDATIEQVRREAAERIEAIGYNHRSRVNALLRRFHGPAGAIAAEVSRSNCWKTGGGRRVRALRQAVVVTTRRPGGAGKAPR